MDFYGYGSALTHEHGARQKLRVKLKLIYKYKYFYFFALPAMAFFIIFAYVPMLGVVVAFKNFNPVDGMWRSEWAGLKHFIYFVKSIYFNRLIRNTLIINGLKFLFGFPAPIVFALLINEVTHLKFKKVVQTFSYLPYFISWVVVYGFLLSMFSPSVGLYGQIAKTVGLPLDYNLFMDDKAFVPMVILTSIWKGFGWGSIIYLAAITQINPELYEAAFVDGARRLRQIWHITLPGIKHIIVMFAILTIGGILNSDFVQIIVLVGNNPSLFEVGDVIDTYVYRIGILSGNFSYATAIGVFKGFISLLLVYLVNKAAKKTGEEGIW